DRLRSAEIRPIPKTARSFDAALLPDWSVAALGRTRANCFAAFSGIGQQSFAFRVKNRGERRVNDFAHLHLGAPGLPVCDLILVGGSGQAHLLIHIDDGKDLTHAGGVVGAGAVKGPAGMEADVAHAKGALLDAAGGQLLFEVLLTFVADGEVAAELQPMTAGSEGDRAHFERDIHQRDPGGDDFVAAHRPVVLIGVPGGKASAGLLEERLVVPKANAAAAHKLRRKRSQSLAEDELADRRASG